jgi:hypothetical protein
MRYDLESEFQESQELIKLLSDDNFCSELWTAFANITWYKAFDPLASNIDNVVIALTSEQEGRTWSASFRGMGSVISELRNQFLDKNEDYMDWYCSNYATVRGERTQEYEYGHITQRVRELLLGMGWKPVEDSHYYLGNP